MQPTVVELVYETSDDTLNAVNGWWADIWDFWWYSKCSQLLWRADIWDLWWHSKCSQLLLSWHVRLLMILWMQSTVVELAYETSDDTLNASNCCWADLWDFWWFSECSQPCHSMLCRVSHCWPSSACSVRWVTAAFSMLCWVIHLRSPHLGDTAEKPSVHGLGMRCGLGSM